MWGLGRSRLRHLRIVDVQYTSNDAIVLGVLEARVSSEITANRIMASVERTLVRDVELLARLEDA